MSPVSNLLSKLSGVRPSGNETRGKKWSARCPAHDDRRPSLSVSEGDDGRALVHCYAGCTAAAICAAVGLQLSDLMPDTPSTVSTSTQPQQAGNKQGFRRQEVGKPATYDTAEAAIADLERKLGERSTQWTYRDAGGNPVGIVVRWDKPGGKDIRPVSRRGDRWIIGGMPEPRPLYGLPDLADANRVYVTEGEKAADAARINGLVATTSAHGAQSAEKTDWSPLAGKECVILPDYDQPGEMYASRVAAILAKLTPAPVVKIVSLPGLPDHGDLADWVTAQSETDVGELRRQLEALADEAEVLEADRPAARIERFRPFPTHVLPEPVQSFVAKGAKAIGCDECYIALPLLTSLASAIGNTRRLRVKRSWDVVPIIWTAIVGESGSSKTPAFKLAMQSLRDLQTKAIEAHAEATKKYEVELAEYEKQMASWKRDKEDDGPPPDKPERPEATRYIVSDTTVEALIPLLLENPRGLLLARDELAGWFSSFDRYTGGRGGADEAHWLSMHSGDTIVNDRKSCTPRTICVPQASVSVTGGIQPGVLHRALGREHRESGLAARVLLACPPRKIRKWTEDDVAPEVKAQLAATVERLLSLDPTTDKGGQPCAVVATMTAEAKAAWILYYDRHASEQSDMSGDLSAAWSKLEEYAARLALVTHYVRWAANDPTLQHPDVVDVASMKSGIELAEWFKHEARRVYALLGESDQQQVQRRLVEWIERKGGSVTTRQVQQGNRQYGNAIKAEAALNELVKASVGSWHITPSGPKGGRSKCVFRLYDDSASTQPDESRGLGSSVDVDGVDPPKKLSMVVDSAMGGSPVSRLLPKQELAATS